MCAIPAQKQRIGQMVESLLPKKGKDFLYRAYNEALKENFRSFKNVDGKHIQRLLAATRYLRKLQYDNKTAGGELHDYAPEKVAKILQAAPDVVRNEIKHYAFYGTHLNKAEHAFNPEENNQPRLSKKQKKKSERERLAQEKFEQGKIGSLAAQSDEHSTVVRSKRDLGVKDSAPCPCSEQPNRPIQTIVNPGPAKLYVKRLIAKETKATRTSLSQLQVDGIISYYRDTYDDEDCPPPMLEDEAQKRSVKNWFRKNAWNEAMWNKGEYLPKPMAKLRALLGNFMGSPAFVS